MFCICFDFVTNGYFSVKRLECDTYDYCVSFQLSETRQAEKVKVQDEREVKNVES